MKIKKVKQEFDFNNVGKVHNLVNNVAGIIVSDIKNGVAKGVDINNQTFTPLKPSTVRAKRRRGSSTPRKPLLDTHRMVGRGGAGGSQSGGDFTGGTGIYIGDRATPQKLRASIKIPADRQYIGGLHNEGDGDLPKREWFGVSGRAIRRLDKMVSEWIKLNLFIGRK